MAAFKEPGDEVVGASIDTTSIGRFTEANLNGQGFGGLDAPAKSAYALPLRFSPGVGTVSILVGLLLQSPVWLGSMAIVALTGALWPRGMLLDLVCNLSVRHLFHAPKLPATPSPRRFSYGLSTVLLTGSSVCFAYGAVGLGFVLGGMVVLGGSILTASLWCLGSWWFRLLSSAAGGRPWVNTLP